MKTFLKRIYNKIVPWGYVNEKIFLLYNKMEKARRRKNKFLTKYYCYKIEKRYHCRISPGAKIGKNLHLPHPDGVVIGEGCKIGKDVIIYQQVTIGQRNEKYPVIGDGAIIYAGAKVIGGIHIGKNSIIGANAVVTHDVPDGSTWAGVPARELSDGKIILQEKSEK